MSLCVFFLPSFDTVAGDLGLSFVRVSERMVTITVIFTNIFKNLMFRSGC